MINWRWSIPLLTAAALLLVANVPAMGAVPPAGGSGFGGSSSSSGGAFGGGVRTPGATVPSGSFNFVPPAASSMTNSSSLTPGTGNLSFPSGTNNIQFNNSTPGAATTPRQSFQGQGSGLGAFGSNFPGQAGLGGDFRGPAGAAGGVVTSGSSPITPQPNQQPNTQMNAQATTSGATSSGSPTSNLVVGNNSNPLVVRSATGPGLSQTPTGAPATAAAQTYDWRYMNYNGTLWYWTPNNTWLYYQNGWQTFSPASTSQSPTAAQSGGQTPYVAGAGGNSATGPNTVVR